MPGTTSFKPAEDRMFGSLCIREGYVTPEQLDECLQIQKTGSDTPRKLGQILVEKGYLKNEQLASILGIQKREVKTLVADPAKGGLFGQIALDLNYVPPHRLEECLAEQTIMSRSGQPMMLGQILLRKGYLQTDQFLQILRIQRSRVVRCPGCDTFYRIDPQDEGQKFACHRCGTVVTIPIPESQNSPMGPGRISPLAVPMRKDAGAQIGRYVILDELGRGGMGIVYKALHKDLNSLFAVKILRETEFSSNELLSRFRREAQAAARLKHPNIVAIHDAAEEAGIHYIVMDYIEGDPLAVHMSRKFKLRDMIVRFEKIVRALQHAHEHGIVHRDMKPANVMIDLSGEPHVMDFGLAKFLDAKKSVLTRSGAFLGTPYYMAPEQIRSTSDAVDARSDVYSLGVILYEIITGRTPYSGQNSVEIFNKIINDEPIPPRTFNARLHSDIQTICLKAMEKNPALRYPTAGEMAEDLRRYLDGEPIVARPLPLPLRLVRRIRKNKTRVLAAVSILLLLFSGTVLLLSLGRGSREFARLKEEGRNRLNKLDYEGAIEQLEAAKSLRAGDDEVLALINRATAQLKIQREDQAKERALQDKRRQAEPRILDARKMLDMLPQQITHDKFDPAEIARRCGAIEKLLAEALDIAEGHEEVYYLRGCSKDFRSDTTGAIEDFTRALGRAPKHLDAKIARGRLHLKRYCLGGALSLRPAGIPPPPGPVEDRRQAQNDFKSVWLDVREPWLAGFAEAALLHLDGRTVEAAAKLDILLERYPADIESLRLRAIILIALGDPQRAETDLDRAVRYRPADISLWIWRALARELKKDPTGADEFLAGVTTIAPDDPLGYLARGRIRYDRARYEEALGDYRRAADLAATMSDPFLGMGQVRMRQQNPDAALIALTRAIQLEPRDPYPYYLRADAFTSLHRPVDALKDCDTAIQFMPEAAAGYELRGRIHFSHERYEPALKDFEKVLSIEPAAQARLEKSVRTAKDKLGRP